GRNEPEAEAPRIPAHGECAILLVQREKDVAVALQQPWPEAVELHLLGVVLPREHGLEVGLHARLGRAPAEQAESIPGELRLRDEGGQAREQEDRDRPRGETRKQHGVADELNAVLSEAEGARDQAQRPARGL